MIIDDRAFRRTEVFKPTLPEASLMFASRELLPSAEKSAKTARCGLEMTNINNGLEQDIVQSFPQRQQQHARDNHGGTDDDSERNALHVT
jgi:hypothetical protein